MLKLNVREDILEFFVIALVVVLTLALVYAVAREIYQGPLVQGVVTNHYYSEPYSTIHFIDAGNNTQIPVTDEWPATWRLQIAGTTTKHYEVMRWIDVSPADFKLWSIR